MLDVAHQPSTGLDIVHGQIDLTDLLAPCFALFAQCLERAHPSFVARAPRLDTLPNPDLFFSKFLVKIGTRLVFGLQLLFFKRLVTRIALLVV